MTCVHPRILHHFQEKQERRVQRETKGGDKQGGWRKLQAVKKGVGVWSVGKHVHSGGRTHADIVSALK